MQEQGKNLKRLQQEIKTLRQKIGFLEVHANDCNELQALSVHTLLPDVYFDRYGLLMKPVTIMAPQYIGVYGWRKPIALDMKANRCLETTYRLNYFKNDMFNKVCWTNYQAPRNLVHIEIYHNIYQHVAINKVNDQEIQKLKTLGWHDLITWGKYNHSVMLLFWQSALVSKKYHHLKKHLEATDMPLDILKVLRPAYARPYCDLLKPFCDEPTVDDGHIKFLNFENFTNLNIIASQQQHLQSLERQYNRLVSLKQKLLNWL